MYHIMVAGTRGFWDRGTWSYPMDRVLEGQKGPVYDRLRTMTPEVIEEMRTYPLILAYEGKDENVRIGRITRMIATPGMVSGTFDLESSIAPIPYAKLDALAGQLDLGNTNNSRSNWKVKEADLFDVLVKAKVIDATCTACQQELPWSRPSTQSSDVWALLHPRVVGVAKPRFDAGHYTDAVDATFKVLSSAVKELYQARTGVQKDGVDLMRKAFTPSLPVIKLGDLETESGRNTQQGYMEIFAGAMAAIRNPNAHELIVISPERAIHHLMLASLLFGKLDEQVA